jgi:hypothetical protein
MVLLDALDCLRRIHHVQLLAEDVQRVGLVRVLEPALAVSSVGGDGKI